MKEISLCMIVKDEEEVIGRCLDSVRDIADEIIIVDTGSTDRTKEIVSQYTDKIFNFKWVDDFSKARNFSFLKATKDYILWLDADDVIKEEDYKKFMELKKELDGSIDLYQMKYNYMVDINDNPTLVQMRERLLKREKNYQWESPIHEVIIPTGVIKKVDIAITHKKQKIKDINRNLKIFEKMEKQEIQLDARQEYCYAKELYYLKKYDEAILKYEKYLNKYGKDYQSKRSFLYSAILELVDCYKIMGEDVKRLDTLMIVLKNEVPGAECCCKIGEVFLEKKEYNTAIFWFLQAVNNDVKQDEEANADYKEFLPYINLCVCYYWMGDLQKSYEYNELAGKIKPNNKTYLYNKSIFRRNVSILHSKKFL